MKITTKEPRRKLLLLNSAHLFTDDHDLLSRQIFKREDKPPVEIALSVHGPVMDISLLSLVFATQPAGNGVSMEKWQEN